MSKTTRAHEEAHAELARLKRDGETFDDLISRLLQQQRENIGDGVDLWSGSDAAEEAREGRARMKRELGR